MVLEIMPNISFFPGDQRQAPTFAKVVPLVEEPILGAYLCLSLIVVLMPLFVHHRNLKSQLAHSIEVLILYFQMWLNYTKMHDFTASCLMGNQALSMFVSRSDLHSSLQEEEWNQVSTDCINFVNLCKGTCLCKHSAKCYFLCYHKQR